MNEYDRDNDIEHQARSEDPIIPFGEIFGWLVWAGLFLSLIAALATVFA